MDDEEQRLLLLIADLAIKAKPDGSCLGDLDRATDELIALRAKSPTQPTRQAVAEWYRSRTVYDSPIDLIMKALVHFGVNK